MRPESDRDPIAVKNAHATLASSYELIEQHMNGRDWLAGDTFSMADCAAAPSLFYAMTHLPFAPTQPNLAAYFERLVTRPSVARVLAEARPYFHLYPLRHAIPARFLDAP
jgi:glutathione S-transferase